MGDQGQKPDPSVPKFSLQPAGTGLTRRGFILGGVAFAALAVEGENLLDRLGLVRHVARAADGAVVRGKPARFPSWNSPTPARGKES